MPLDLRAGRQPSVCPWQVIAEIAASLHGVDIQAAPPPVPGFPTRREHALAALQCFDGLDGPDLQDARAWALEHLPPAEPAALLHGDLLGQNVLLGPGATPPFAVIDWEYATMGDPAYDLAVVTRGVRRPFRIVGGLERLLEDYAKLSGRTIDRSHVRIHELALAARWYRDALARTRRGGPTSQGGGGGSPEGQSAEDALALIRRISRMR
jgi:aminoglycoside phosphotransferase (APT) family kinase protein